MSWKTYNPKQVMPKHYKDLSEWGVDIPTTDIYAYSYYGKPFNWVYNKLKICESQNLSCGPIGTIPTEFPIIIKPIINLLGGGNRASIAHNMEQYIKIQDGGLFWSPFQIGEHYSIDLIILEGKVQTTFWFRGEKLQLGMFDFWELTNNYPKQLHNYVTDWVESNLFNYTGCVNLEVIGEAITEVHLRMGDIDRFGSQPLMEAIHILYNSKKWPNIELEIPESFYITALFSQPNVQFFINTRLADSIFSELTYYQFDSQTHIDNNPPAGKRLAIFCDENFERTTKARNIAIGLFKPYIDGKYTDALTNYEDLRI